MELSFHTLITLPIGLGLLGFIEPCTVGGHLMFLDTQNERSKPQKISAVLIFILTRAVIAGLFGAVIAYAGHALIGLQTGLWLAFGSIYLIIGLAFMFGGANTFKKRLDLAPNAWKRARHPAVLGLAFGLNIPACAAPILFALLGVAATTGTALTGFTMMFVFGFFLSAPLLAFAIIPKLAGGLQSLGARLKRLNWLLGASFIVLGLWSIWFGLYVDPANWSGQ